MRPLRRSQVFIVCMSLCSGKLSAVEVIPPNLGVSATAAEIAARDNLVFPDGEGLPPGSGTVSEGRAIFEMQCASCHGPGGRGGFGGELAGGDPDLTRDSPDKSIGSYWPYATTLFDFIRRAMPMTAPWSLSDAQVYAVTAYLLRLNGIIAEGTRLDAATLAAIKMPNRDGFIGVDAQAAPASKKFNSKVTPSGSLMNN